MRAATALGRVDPALHLGSTGADLGGEGTEESAHRAWTPRALSMGELILPLSAMW